MPGRRGPVVACLAAVWEDPGSNLTAGSCVYHDSQSDIGLQPWERAAHPYNAVILSILLLYMILLSLLLLLLIVAAWRSGNSVGRKTKLLYVEPG